MNTTRRDLLTAALTAVAGATVTTDGAQAKEHTDHQVVPSDPALRVKALESLLVAKGLVDPAAVDALIDTYEHKVGPRNGARAEHIPGELISSVPVRSSHGARGRRRAWRRR